MHDRYGAVTLMLLISHGFFCFLMLMKLLFENYCKCEMSKSYKKEARGYDKVDEYL